MGPGSPVQDDANFERTSSARLVRQVLPAKIRHQPYRFGYIHRTARLHRPKTDRRFGNTIGDGNPGGDSRIEARSVSRRHPKYTPGAFNATRFAELSDLDQRCSKNLRHQPSPTRHRYRDPRDAKMNAPAVWSDPQRADDHGRRADRVRRVHRTSWMNSRLSKSRSHGRRPAGTHETEKKWMFTER